MATQARPRGRPRVTVYQGSYEDLGTRELSPEQEVHVQAQIKQADEDTETHVNMRWGKGQLLIIRKAAALAGVPYQSYLKQAAIGRAIEDLRAAKQAGVA